VERPRRPRWPSPPLYITLHSGTKADTCGRHSPGVGVILSLARERWGGGPQSPQGVDPHPAPCFKLAL